MREIKFRGKRIDNGQWVYGSHRLFKNGTGNRHFIIDYDEPINGGIEYEVDTATVGQYTGLKDKNGVEIYEGDVVLSHNITYVCKWNRYRCEFAWYSLSNDYIYPIGDARLHLEVIGNVYENPELLEGVKADV